MSLPAAWVDRLFSRLSLRYGEAFTRQYAGMDMATVKADWAECLGFMASRPDAIAYGLERLEEWPPHALRFKSLCLPALAETRQQLPALPAPPVDPAKAAAAVAVFKSALAERETDLRAWARRLRAREQAGERLTIAQRDAWREALANELGEEVAA